MINFKIVIPAYNCEKWISKTIESIKNQNYKNFECLLIDDMSTDKTYEIMTQAPNGDSRFNFLLNFEKKFALKNFVDGFSMISNNSEDVLINIDGDDWLASENVLQKVADMYDKTDCLMTYGSFVEYPSKIIHQYYLSPYDDCVIENNIFRSVPWKASHLRTFKKKLWDKIDLADFINEETGKYYEVAWDLAIMFPMLEMSHSRSEHISDILYVYNKQNPLSDMYIKEEEQIRIANQIRSKKKYSRIKL